MRDNKIVMRSKEVLSIIAFFLAFGISVAVTPRQSNTSVAPYVKRSCTATATARKITNLLTEDIENGRARERRIKDFAAGDEDYSPLGRKAYFANYSGATDDYANESAGIDDRDLPGDFQSAWRAHMRAWRNQADFLNQGSEEFSRKEYYRNSREISETWYEVLRTARKYNAEIPPGAY